jgi:ATP-dependent Clp protease ATP-binding subunit ClpA
VITDVQEVGDRRAQGGAGARKIASGLGSPTVEAEHLLLAVARQPGTIAQQVLREAGLDYDRIGEALDAEFEGTLATVGVSLGDFDLSACGGTSRAARWGTSAKLALARSAKIADARRDRRMAPGHIVLGILRAPTGAVPRALERAGIDRVELSDRVAAAL